jgi:hypothetical protein
MEKAFKARLVKVKREGRLTTADLAVLFDRPYATVDAWLRHGREPAGPHGEESRKLLVKIERAIAKQQHFPVPFRLSPIARREYATKVRHALNGGLPQTHPAA